MDIIENLRRTVLRDLVFIAAVSLTGLALTTSAQVTTAPTREPIVAPQHIAPAGLDPGELLISELNCVACHQAQSAIKARLASRTSPLLGESGLRITPQYLRAFLQDPHREKPGTTMPDVLHGMNESQKAETVENLVHFLVSLDKRPAADPIGADHFKIQQGRTLYHQVGCVACHAPDEPAEALRPKPSALDEEAPVKTSSADLENLKSTSAPLGNLAKKTTVEQLTQFLLDPLKTRPSGRMPSLNLDQGEATAIAMYLLRDQANSTNTGSRAQRIKGVSYQYFQAQFNDSPNFDRLRVNATGFADHFTLAVRKRNSNFGLRFSGFLNVPTEGIYTFYTESDDGSRLYIGDKLVVQNDGMHAPQERSGKIGLKAGEHPILVTYFNGGGGAELKVSYEAPGLSKREIPASALSHIGQPMYPVGEEKLAVDAVKASRGKELFSSLGCAACHQVGGVMIASSPVTKALNSLDAEKPDGCLGARPGQGLPRFSFSDSQRAVLRNTLQRVETLTQSVDAKAQINRTMAALNCFACHSRDGIGGPERTRSEYFGVIGEADLGDEGRIPPHLTKVGDKLKPEWLREVLLRSGKVRPYMATRMPRFGDANVGHLLTAFEQADNSKELKVLAEASARDAKFGRKLVGREGLTCISCHTFGKYKSLGVPAMDLTQMAKRLQKDWFQRYLLDPVSLRPGTRMPTFWPEGKAANKEIFDGDTDRQINAIWAYLSRGAEAEVPDGLIQAKLELVVEKEATIYRNFIEGAGSRAIGVGYPEKANLAFDANNVRLALVWQGAFIDASRHRSDRGVGFEPPLGNQVTQMPPGPSFAILADANAPWPEVAGKKGGYRMQGYRLDEKRRPTFLYSFGEVQIEDYPVGRAGEVDPELVRTLTLHSDKPIENLYFRAAVGSKMEEKDGGYAVDGRMTIKLTNSGAKPVVRQSNGRSELLVPVVFNLKNAQIVEEFLW